MRGASGLSPGLSQGLTWRIKQKNLKSREITERKQVGDAESLINEGKGATGHHGFFGVDGGEV